MHRSAPMVAGSRAGGQGGGVGTPASMPRFMTETATDLEQMQHTLMQLLPRYKVLLHNDDHNTMGHVVYALRRVVPGISRAEALRIMLEAHEIGVAVVILCPKELAEHYREGLRSYGLISTIELDS